MSIRAFSVSALTNLCMMAAALSSVSTFAQKIPGLPEPGPVRPVHVPAATSSTLPNGLRVVSINRPVTPLVTVGVYVMSGSEVDPQSLAGVADLTASLLTQGTATRTAPQIAQAADTLGGTLGSGAGWDNAQATITVTTPKLDAAVDLLADVVRHPAFAQDEIDRARKQTLDGLRVSLSQPGSLARLVAARATYGDGAYAHSATGTPASLARIKRDDIVALHSTWYRPDNMVMVFAGDIDAARASQLAAKAFGDWKAPATKLPATPAGVGKNSLPASIAIDLPGTGQAAVQVVRAGIQRTAPDYFPGIVANAVIGGGYSARLNEEIRIKRGLSYGAGSSLAALRHAGSFGGGAQTKNESAVEVVGLVLAELTRLSSEPTPADELVAREAALTGNFGFSLETTRGLAGQVAALALNDLPLDDLAHFVDKVQAVTPAQVQQFAKDHLSGAGSTIIVAGDAKQFFDALKKAYPSSERIAASELDLDSADLKPHANQ